MDEITVIETHAEEIKVGLQEKLGRSPTPDEIVNTETDALLIAQFLRKKVAELETRIAKLEKI